MLRQPRPARRTRALAAAVVAALPFALPVAQSAAFTPYRTWVGATNGSWNVASNWSPSGVPGSSESLTIAGTTSSYTVNYNGSYTTSNGPAMILFDAPPTTLSPSNSLTFNHTATYVNNNLASASEAIGYTAGRATYAQTVGTNAVIGNLLVGYNAGATGTYTLSGTGVLTAGEEAVGLYGSGTVNQSAGTHTVATTVNNMSTLHIGYSAGSSGTYTLSGGKLSAVNLFLGEGGTGSVVQTGGTLAVTGALPTGSNTLSAEFSIARNAGSTGSYSLSGAGNLSVGSSTSIGGSTTAAGGTGNLTVSAGTASLAAVKVYPGSRLTLNGGILSATSLTLNGPNAFDFSGGTFFAPLATLPAATFRFAFSSGLAFSTAANADPQHRLGVGYTATGSTLTARLTYLGDANLDGKITRDDFALIDRGFAKHLSTWQDGDFDYDGSVTTADYLLIDRVFTQQTGTLSPDLLAQRESQFGADYVSQLLTSVPEPSSLACLFAGSLFLARRRPK